MLEEKCLICRDMVCSDNCKGTSELTLISSRCEDHCVSLVAGRGNSFHWDGFSWPLEFVVGQEE